MLFSGQNNLLREEVQLWNDIISLSLSGDIIVGLKKDGRVVIAGQPRSYYLDTSTWCDLIDIGMISLLLIQARNIRLG